MKNSKSNSIMTKFITLVTIIGLSLFLGTAASAATLNVVGSAPLVLIGGSGSAGTITIAEVGAGALSETAPNNTIVIDLPSGVTFGSDPVATVTAGAGLAISGVTLSNSDSTAKWEVTNESTAASTIVIQLPNIAVGASVSKGDIVANINSGVQANPGLTEGDVTIAVATEGKAVATIDSAVNVSIDSTGNAITDIEIFESTQGSLESGDTVELQLPTGVTFDGTPTISGEMGSTITFINTTVTDGLATFEVDVVSTVPATVTITGLSIDVADTVSAGDINGELTSGDALDQTLTLATAANSGISATVVAPASADPDLAPAELDAEDIPVSPAGRLNVTTAAIFVEENFAGDLTSTDELTITLPSGVTFFQNYNVETPTGTDVTPDADPTGFASSTLDIGQNALLENDLILGGNSSLSVILDASVPVGPVVATLSGTVKGEDITPIELTILEVVATGVTVEANETIPSVGLGSDGAAFGDFTITESNFGALLANNSTITIALPEGVTFDAVPTENVTPGNVVLSAASLNTDDDVATFKVTDASTTASVITISGALDVAADFPVGPISATIGGSAGASGTVLIANSANGVEASVTSTPTLVVNAPTQDISNIVLTEAFAGALGGGAFRLLTNTGSWATNDPEIATEEGEVTTTVADCSGADCTFDGDDDSGSNVWDFNLDSTFKTNDTLIVYIPANIATTATDADVITLSKLRLNVPAGTEEGPVNITLIDGNEDGDDTAGILGGTLLAGFIGSIEAVVATPDAVELPAGTTAEVTVAGGIGDYTVASADETKATATVDGATITISGLIEGEVVLTVSDGATPANTDEITVTVGPVADLVLDPVEVSLPEGGTATVMIQGGFGPFTAVSADDTKATVAVDGTTITVTGVAAGEDAVEITVTDSNPDTADTATLPVTVTAVETLVVAPEVLNVNLDATGDLTVTGGVGPFSAVSSDVAVATVAVADAVVTVTAVAAGTATVTVTDNEGTEATATVNIVKVVPVPDAPVYNEPVTTPEEIAELDVQFGDVALTEGGSKMEVTTTFPAFEGAVDIWVAFVLPGATDAFLFNENNEFVRIDLTSTETQEIPAFRINTMGPITETLIPEFDTCNFLGEPTVPVGLWGVTYIIAPTNGGVFEDIGSDDPSEQFTYFFDVSCD